MTEGLTRQDVRTLQHADALCFDHTGVGTGQIRAIRRAEKSSSGFEETHVIPAHSSRVQTFGPEDGSDLKAFAMIHSAQYSDIGRTLVRHMREGSRFSLEWTRDNSSPVLDKAGLVRDELHVRVQGKNSKVADVFLIEVRVGLDDTARMVTRA